VTSVSSVDRSAPHAGRPAGPLGGDAPDRAPDDAPNAPDYPVPVRLIGFERDAIEPFFRQVPRLFEAAQAPVHASYQELLYTVEHEFDPDDLRHIERLFGLESPQWAVGSRDEAIHRLDAMRFPDTTGLSELRAVPGLTLPVASHYLHFFHHTYPIYEQSAVEALNRLGAPVPWTKVRNADVYGLYIAAIEELRDRIPFWHVPETNVHINRILQAALSQWGTLGRNP
jgi:hypothetical protein